MRYRFWRLVDVVAHLLYCPATAGRRLTRHTWAHDVHLLPAAWLEWVCGRLELACGMTQQEIRVADAPTDRGTNV